MKSKLHSLPTIGWREWMSLPSLNIEHIKVKVDTGARTSALHAYYVSPFIREGVDWVRFGIHPIQKNAEIIVECEAPVTDQRIVTDSGGHEENRYVIETELILGNNVWTAEVTLTDRDSMGYRMLLGRTAMNGRFLVDPSASYLIGQNQPHHKEPVTQPGDQHENRHPFAQ